VTKVRKWTTPDDLIALSVVAYYAVIIRPGPNWFSELQISRFEQRSQIIRSQVVLLTARTAVRVITQQTAKDGE